VVAMSGTDTRRDFTKKKTELPVFVTAENRSQLMEIYDEALRHWPIPFEPSFVTTRYGKTHVIASGNLASPPLILLHPMGVGGFVWSSIINVLSEQWRTYALDTIGDVGKSELADPDHYPKQGRDYSAWLDDVFAGLAITRADVVAGSMGGWIAMNHAIYAPDRLRRLVLLGPMGLAPWRATLSVLGPFLSQRFRPSAAKLDKIITRSLGEGESVNRAFRPWMRIMGYTKARVGQPFHLSAKKLRKITTPTLVFLGGKDGLVGDVAPAKGRAQRYIAGCEVEVLPNAGHVMSVDEPDLVATRIVEFLVRPAE
jgi:pimeloyl-ACP methyl ester carboxylesterase